MPTLLPGCGVMPKFLLLAALCALTGCANVAQWPAGSCLPGDPGGSLACQAELYRRVGQ